MARPQWHAETTSRYSKPLALAVIILALIITNVAIQNVTAESSSPSKITIWPVAPGNITELRPNSSENWNAVNDGIGSIVVQDINTKGDIYSMVFGDYAEEENLSDDATYVSGSANSSWNSDVYRLQYPVISGNISKVTIFIRCMTTAEGKTAKTVLQIGNASYYGQEIQLSSSYENYTTDYQANPATGDAWTWPDIAKACWGVALNDSTARCSRVWAVVEYTHFPGTIGISTDTTSRMQCILFEGDTLQIDATWIRKASNRYAMVVGRGDGITIKGSGEIKGNWTNAETSTDPLIYIKGNRTLIDGIAVEGNRHTGIMLANPSNCTVRNITVRDCCSSRSYPSLGVGILLYGPGSCNHITGCAIERAGLHGVQIFQTDDTEISNNYINGVVGFFGISIYGYGDDVANGALINGNTIKNTRCEGINADNGENLAIDHNYIDNVLSDYGLCIYRSSWGIVEFNSINRSFKDGIALDGSSNFVVRYNTITNCASGGDHHTAVLVQGTEESDAKNNLIEGNYIYDESLPANASCSIKEIQAAEHVADYNVFRDNIAIGNSRPNTFLTGPNSINDQGESDEMRTSES